MVYTRQAELQLLCLLVEQVLGKLEGSCPCSPPLGTLVHPGFPLPVCGGGLFLPSGRQEPSSYSGLETGEAVVPQPPHRHAGPLGPAGRGHLEAAASAQDLSGHHSHSCIILSPAWSGHNPFHIFVLHPQPSHLPCLASCIPHPASHIPHPTSCIPHSPSQMHTSNDDDM